uniref:ABC transporter A family member 9-like n=1 Tax=Tanacetum cinerariifolium TaxID=118510 RepID=A0A6L2KK56_TANCI|nr:ABC transporter A family member 9-like [Tanacetum cinerariifolium]
MEDHTSNWLRVVPISRLGQTMNGRTYQSVLCYRLGVPLFSVPKPYSACTKVFAGDIYTYHVVSCADSKEVDIGLGGGRDKPLRPADMLLYSWDRGLDVCVDLICSSPLTQTETVDFVSGHAVIEATQRNHIKSWNIRVIEITSSIDEPPEVKLKDLPPHLEYVFLEGDDKLPVIIAKDLSDEEKTALITVLKPHKKAIAWKLSDIKGINPNFYTHKILMEEDFEPTVCKEAHISIPLSKQAHFEGF